MAEGNEQNINETEERDENNHNTEFIRKIKPVIFIEYCLGVFRFSIADGKILPPNKYMKMFSILLCVLLLAVIGFLLLHLEASITINKNFIEAMTSVSFLLLVLGYLKSTITMPFMMSTINMRIVSMFKEMDKIINIALNQDFCKSCRASTWIYLIINIIYLIVITVYYWVDEEIVPITKIITAWLFYFQKIEIVVFCLMINMLKHRLNKINDYLLKFIEVNNKDVVFTITGDRNVQNENYNWIGIPSNKNIRIHDLALAYEYIGSICEKINNVFNFDILMVILFSFASVVITIWNSLYYYLFTEYKIEVVVRNIIWSLIAIVNIITLSYSCGTLLSVREDTRSLVNKLIMNYDLPKTMRVQAKAFMDLIDVWPLNITVYDMFDIDITLLLKFINVSTTYLIIIIQIHHLI